MTIAEAISQAGIHKLFRVEYVNPSTGSCYRSPPVWYLPTENPEQLASGVTFWIVESSGECLSIFTDDIDSVELHRPIVWDRASLYA